MSSRWVLAFAIAASSALAACSSDSDSSAGANPATDSGAGDSGGTADADEDTAKVPCSEPEDERPAGSECILKVTGKVVDADGKPVSGKSVSVCGFICFYATSGEDGTFQTDIGSFIVPTKFAANVHGRPEYSSVYVPLPAPADQAIAITEPLVLNALPDSGPALPIDDSGVVTVTTPVTSGDLTLAFGAGTHVELDPEDFADPKGSQLRVVKIDPKNYPKAFQGVGITSLWAASPFDAQFTDGKDPRKVGVAVPNAAGLAANTAVEFVALGREFVRSPFTAGSLQVVGTGKVSGDGTMILTDTGEGITYLTWVGVRPKS